MDSVALILPGIGNSGPEHWQTVWQQKNPAFQRVEQRDWEHPVCGEWRSALENSVARIGPDVVLVAHSLGCALVAHWAATTKLRIKGALLVAPPDPEAPNFPAEAVGFSPLPLEALPFPSILVASTNDPYATFEFAQSCASAWRSRLIDAGPAGHLNASSGLGEWHQGLALFKQLAE